MEHCEQAETTDNIAGAKFSASGEDNNTKRKKKRLRFKGQDEHGKKHQKQHSKLYCSLHGENTSHTTRECNILKAKGKEKPKHFKKDYKRNSREANLLEKQASHQRAKYLKYKSLNKAPSKKSTPVILENFESDSSSSKEEDSSSEEEHSMTYDSESGNSDKSSKSATNTEE